MKVKFLKSTNELFNPLFGIDMDISIGIITHMSYNPEDIKEEERFYWRHGIGRTSTTKNVKFEEISLGCTIITITTRNSEYIFCKGEPSDKKPLTDEEILDFQIKYGMFLF